MRSNLRGLKAGQGLRQRLLLPSTDPTASASIDLVLNPPFNPPSELFAQLALQCAAPPCPVQPGWQVRLGLRTVLRVLEHCPIQVFRRGFSKFGAVMGLSSANSLRMLGWGQCSPSGQNEKNHQKCCSHSLALWGLSQVWEALVG